MIIGCVFYGHDTDMINFGLMWKLTDKTLLLRIFYRKLELFYLQITNGTIKPVYQLPN